MKYLIIFLMIIGVSANNDFEIYKQQVNHLIKYTLKTPDNIYDMFIIQNEPKQKKKIKKEKHKLFSIKTQKNIILLAILNHKVLLKINNNNKWCKVGDRIDDYKIMKILNDNSIIVLNKNKIKILSIKNNNLKIKVR